MTERDRDRETETETDRQTDRQTDTVTETEERGRRVDRDTGPGLMTSHGEPQELAPQAACTHLLVGSLPEDGQHVDRTDRRRQEAGDGLDVMEQLGYVLHDGDPRDAHAHQHDHTQPGIQGT